MSLFTLLIAVVILSVLLALVNKYIAAIPGPLMGIIIFIIAVIVIVCLLQTFGIIHTNIHLT